MLLTGLKRGSTGVGSDHSISTMSLPITLTCLPESTCSTDFRVMTSPLHARNRFGFPSGSSPNPIASPATSTGKNSTRYTPSPTKLESPRIALNNNHSDNGNILMKTSPESGIRNPDRDLKVMAKSVYLVLKPDYSEEILSKAEFKQLLQIGGQPLGILFTYRDF